MQPDTAINTVSFLLQFDYGTSYPMMLQVVTTLILLRNIEIILICKLQIVTKP